MCIKHCAIVTHIAWDSKCNSFRPRYYARTALGLLFLQLSFKNVFVNVILIYWFSFDAIYLRGVNSK